MSSTNDLFKGPEIRRFSTYSIYKAKNVLDKDVINIKNSIRIYSFLFCGMLFLVMFLVYDLKPDTISYIVILLLSSITLFLFSRLFNRKSVITIDKYGLMFNKGKKIKWQDIRNTFIEEELYSDSDSSSNHYYLIILLNNNSEIKTEITYLNYSDVDIASYIEEFKHKFPRKTINKNATINLF